MKGWKELYSDVNWIDYHGMWAKKAADGSWYVLKWTNLVDAGGKEFADTPYECDVKRLDLTEIPESELKSALDCCSLDLEEIMPQYQEAVLVECCISYGLGAPLESFTGSKYPARIRANARRYAEECMRNDALLESRLDRPVNAIGSTAREYGVGDIRSAMYEDRPGTDPKIMHILRRMHGMS